MHEFNGGRVLCPTEKLYFLCFSLKCIFLIPGNDTCADFQVLLKSLWWYAYLLGSLVVTTKLFDQHLPFIVVTGLVNHKCFAFRYETNLIDSWKWNWYHPFLIGGRGCGGGFCVPLSVGFTEWYNFRIHHKSWEMKSDDQVRIRSIGETKN